MRFEGVENVIIIQILIIDFVINEIRNGKCNFYATKNHQKTKIFADSMQN